MLTMNSMPASSGASSGADLTFATAFLRPGGPGWPGRWMRKLGLCLAAGCLGVQVLDGRSFVVEGYGFWGNRMLARAVTIIGTGEEAEPDYPANFIENAVTLMHAKVEADGYLDPNYRLILVDAEGRRQERTWDGSGFLELPADLRARKVRVVVDRGVFHYYETVEFEGLRAIEAREARAFFYRESYLFPSRRHRPYAPAVRKRGRAGVEDHLRALGYREASLDLREVTQGQRPGAMRVVYDVHEGPRYRVVGTEVTRARPSGGFLPEADGVESGELGLPQPWSVRWQQDWVRGLVRTHLAAGFPDVSVQVESEVVNSSPEEVEVRLRAVVEPGDRVQVKEVRLSGLDRTRESVVRRRIGAAPGDWLNLPALERARLRLGRLGVFRSVVLTVEEDGAGREKEPEEQHPHPLKPEGTVADLDWDEPGRRVVEFTVEEAGRVEAGLLLGYGSYEKLRGGFEVDRRNLWGRAHQDRMRVMQSFRSSTGSYLYRMPEVFGEDLALVAEANALYRQELSFDRYEWGGEGRFVKEVGRGTQAIAGFRLERLRTVGLDEALDFKGNRRTRVGAFQFAFSRDLRDNPMRPRSGHHLRAEIEIGSPFLGAEVSYQRWTASWAGHWELAPGWSAHFGISHHVVTTWGGMEDELPVNKRFFPGGAQSIRGFRQGGASPRDSAGQFIGAETHTLVQLELERDLGPSLSGLVLFDQLYLSREVRSWPGDEYLASLGLGLRYRTLVGPVRAELAFNLNPRAFDPSFRFHLSVGVPF